MTGTAWVRRNSRGMSGHHSARAKSTEWGTPPEVIDRINALRPRRTDPCSMLRPSVFIAPICWTKHDNGLLQPWEPPFYLNPPYTVAVQALFLERAVAAGDGIGLLFARTETRNWVRFVYGAASAVLYIAGRLHFIDHSGRRADANAGGPSALIAWGAPDLDVLAELVVRAEYDARDRVIWPAGMIPGELHILRLPRSILAVFIGTWRELIEREFGDREFSMAELYRLVSHPKARCNRNPREKLRQTVNRGGFERVARGRYRRARAA